MGETLIPGRLPPEIAAILREARRLERQAAALDLDALRAEARRLLHRLDAWIAGLPPEARAEASRRLVRALR